GIRGLALSLSIATIVEFALLLRTLVRRLHGLDGAHIVRSVARTSVASVVMGEVILLWLGLMRLAGILDLDRKPDATLAVVGGIAGRTFLSPRGRGFELSFTDKTLVCRDCKQNFTFTAGEQEFYANKGLQNEPVRCSSCRSNRKTTQTREPEEGYVRYGVFASFGGRTPRQMHPATCAECGMMT